MDRFHSVAKGDTDKGHETARLAHFVHEDYDLGPTEANVASVRDLSIVAGFSCCACCCCCSSCFWEI